MFEPLFVLLRAVWNAVFRMRLHLTLIDLRIAHALRASRYQWDRLPDTLQKYWLRDPTTGRERTEADLLHSQEIVQTTDGRKWHTAHLPLTWGGQALKSAWSVQDWAFLEAQLSQRLAGAQKTPTSPNGVAVGAERRALFDGVVVNRLPSVDGETLHVRCRDAIFLEPALSAGASFGPGADFRGASFMQRFDCRQVRFLGDVCFNGAAFFKEAFFGPRAPFVGRASFDRARFLEQAGFGGAVFESPCDFRRTRFHSACQMQGAKFRRFANFASARFYGSADFQRACFSDAAIFRGAEFHRRASFADARFMHSATFYHALFKGLPEFEEARLHSNTTFSTARFRKVGLIMGGAWLSLAVGVLLSLWLAGYAPFESAVLPEAVRWAALVPLGAALWAGSRVWIIDRELERYSRAFRYLSRRATEFNNRSDASKFLREELRAQRLRPSANPLERGLSFIYDALCGYSHSLVGSFAMLVIATGAYALAFLAWERAAPQNMLSTASAFIDRPVFDEFAREAGELSLRNVFQPFSIWATSSTDPPCSFRDRLLALPVRGVKAQGGATWCRSAWMAGLSDDELGWHRVAVRLVATSQSVLAALLLFLAGVAARRRFQIGA
jgi:uncharacterized protein YjbI with pentapeptide repeats